MTRRARREANKPEANKPRRTSEANRPDGKTAAAVAPPAPMRTVHEKRMELARRLASFAAEWRRCPRYVCKRRHTCVLPRGGRCASPRQSRPVSPEEWERIKAWTLRMLKQRMAEIEAAKTQM